MTIEVTQDTRKDQILILNDAGLTEDDIKQMDESNEKISVDSDSYLFKIE